MKKNSTFRYWAAAAVFGALLFFGGNFSPLNAQSRSSGSELTRSMEQAIRLYHEGQDNEAMDRFMDILAKGTPSEKSIANEYISKITLRMNTGVPTINDQGSEGGLMKEVTGNRPSSAERKQAAGFDQTPSEEEAAEEEESQAKKERVADKINEKISGMRRALLLDLSKNPALKVYMGDNLPQAVTINSRYFFATETVFRADMASALSELAGLIFTLGKANVLILPEGTVENDVKIKNIRQAIALNSYLVSRGISQSRLYVNLTGADIKFPKELTSISGLIVLFNYDKGPNLMESGDVLSKGPKVSLGVYPTAISIQKKEGVLVEFSVFESPAGKASWKFEIFSVQADNTILSLQKVDGYGPQYNQSYWNGRKNFFGAPYPSGKYLFSVTATDAEGRETNLRRLLVIKPGPEEEKAFSAGKKPAEKAVTVSKAAKPAGKANAAKRKFPLKKGKVALMAGAAGLKTAKAGSRKKVKQTPPARKKTVKSGAPEDEAAPASGESAAKEAAGAREGEAQDSQTEFSGQVSYKIYFREETAIVTPNSEKKLAQVAETMGYYPMAKIKLIGYAYSGEANSETMAQNRVNYVSTRLAGKYKIEKERMDISTQISDTPKSIVEIKMLKE